jgi:transcriptional regulator with XRE-family HTH domain
MMDANLPAHSLNPRYATTEELQVRMGEQLRRLRMERNLEQRTLAAQAGVGLNTLRRLELGQGSSVQALIRVLRALGREEWLATMAPVATINPLNLTQRATPRQRVRRG